MSDTIDDVRTQLQQHAPPGTEVPDLLREFVEWHSEEGEDLGYFELGGGRLDDFWVEDGSRQATAFYSFLACSDGSRIGWWRPGGETLSEASIIQLGGEGELAVVGVGLADFLARWSEGVVCVPDLMLDEEDDGYAARLAAHERFRSWVAALGLKRETVGEDLEERTARLQAWFESWSEQRARKARSDADRVALAAHLRKLVGLPKEPWERNFVDAIITARSCQLFGTYVGEMPLACSPALETALREFRERDATELPEAGVWFRASLELDKDGALTVKRTYLDRPDPNEIELDEEGVVEDMQRMPRSAYWTPPWLAR